MQEEVRTKCKYICVMLKERYRNLSFDILRRILNIKRQIQKYSIPEKLIKHTKMKLIQIQKYLTPEKLIKHIKMK